MQAADQRIEELEQALEALLEHFDPYGVEGFTVDGVDGAVRVTEETVEDIIAAEIILYGDADDEEDNGYGG